MIFDLHIIIKLQSLIQSEMLKGSQMKRITILFLYFLFVSEKFVDVAVVLELTHSDKF